MTLSKNYEGDSPHETQTHLPRCPGGTLARSRCARRGSCAGRGRQDRAFADCGQQLLSECHSIPDDLATAGGHTLVHQPIVVGGASLQLHAEKAQKHEQDANDKDGLYANGRSLQQELAAEPWDFVTIQQASLKSHDLSTYRPYAGQLRDYIQKHAPRRSCWYTRLGRTAATTRGSPPSRRSPANRPRRRPCIKG